MDEYKEKLCPIRNTKCQPACAWWCDFGHECAVPLLAGMFADSEICKTIFDWSHVSAKDN